MFLLFTFVQGGNK